MSRTVRLSGLGIIILLVITASGCGSAMEAGTSAGTAATLSIREDEETGVAEEAEEAGGGAMGFGKYAAPVAPVTPEYAEGEELLCLCDNEEEAQKIADLYGIELVKFGFGVATFHAEDPQAVIDLGKEKGYPELEINAISHIYDN